MGSRGRRLVGGSFTPSRGWAGPRPSAQLSQCPLAHLGAIDPLGLHRSQADGPFPPADHRVARLFHVKLGRLWRRDALRRATDPLSDLPARLAQTPAALGAGCSEKGSVRLGISPHTVHNYLKARH